jgi:hypothetical protein
LVERSSKITGEIQGHCNGAYSYAKSALLWKDLWDNKVRSLELPELFSFTTENRITIRQVVHELDLAHIFHLPLTEQSYQQFLHLSTELENLAFTEETDSWTYIWGSSHFSVHEAYNALAGHQPTHPVFNWLWGSKCQPKHRVFFWLLVQDKLNTRASLQNRHMELESYTCENCILQRLEVVYHLFLICNFARSCWESIGVLPRGLTVQ